MNVGKNILLIIGGGIAAYKSLELIRRLKDRGASVQTVMTSAATEFISPLSVGSLSANKVFTDLFDRDDEHDVGHIRLARDCDAVIVAPATADIMAKMATGLANDLASTILLATNRPILVAPAMNPSMWNHPATKKNVKTLKSYGINFCGPEHGEMAEHSETGIGRMSEPDKIIESYEKMFQPSTSILSGYHVVVTSGPTVEPIDPVRFITNRSSGKQGHAIAQAAADAGAKVTLISGPVCIPNPSVSKIIQVETAKEMFDAVEKSLPADIAIMVAAVADWRVKSEYKNKLKKKGAKVPFALNLTQNPDILSHLGKHKKLRPRLLIGFAAESESLIENAKSKLDKKRADWIVANDIGTESKVFGGDRNKISLVTNDTIEHWPVLGKDQVAQRLIKAAALAVKSKKNSN